MNQTNRALSGFGCKCSLLHIAYSCMTNSWHKGIVYTPLFTRPASAAFSTPSGTGQVSAHKQIKDTMCRLFSFSPPPDNHHAPSPPNNFLLVNWCFEPSQPLGIISGLKETFIKRHTAETTIKADIRPEEQSEKTERCRKKFMEWNTVERAIKTDIDTRRE